MKLGNVKAPLEDSDVEFKVKCIKMHVIFDQALHILGIFNDTLAYVKGRHTQRIFYCSIV